MISNIKILITSLLFILLFACQSTMEDEKQAANNASIERFFNSNRREFTKSNGVYHAIKTKGFGYRVALGDSIAFMYIGYTLDRVVFDTNIKEVAKANGLDTVYRNFNPIKTLGGSPELIEGLSKGLLLCRQNEWATIAFPSTMGMGEISIGTIGPWSPLAYDIFIIYVKNEKIALEQNIINNFVASSQGFVSDNTGLWVKNLVEIESLIKPTINDTIYGWYRGETLDQNIFEELPTQGLMIVLKDNSLIEGIKYGFMMMNPGERIQLLVPSSLGYGNKGTNLVNPYTPTLFELRLDSIKLQLK
jgi:peptidylprolyl isomerase